MRRVATIVALALASLGAATAARPAAPVPDCRVGDLRVSVGRPEGTAGTVYVRIRFLNTSSSACALRGYPGVSSVSRTGARIGSPAARRASAPPRTVVLPPGRRAHADYGQVDVGVFDAAACRPAAARGLRVYPPNSFASVVVPWPHRACSRAVRDSTIAPVQPG